MDKRHIIKDVEFDITFDSTAAAREHESGLPAFIRERLLPLADEIFCELADDGMVARIDRLEIDLGAIRCNGFRGEMESRFREKLRSLLREKMRAPATAHSPVEGRLSRQQIERGQLEVFLETGRMPWHAERATGETADAMLEQTLGHQGGAFAEFLKRTPHRDVVVKRLARQFPDRLLTDVMRLLAPAHAAILGDLIGKLGAAWKKKTAGITEKELKSQVWERLIGEHLESGVSDPERLVRNIVKELLVRHAKSEDMAGRSASALESEPVWSADDFMYELHDAADRRGETPFAVRQPEGAQEWGTDTARLRALLEIAFASGDAGELSGRWEELRGEHRELVRAVFMQRMGEARLRQKVADGFPETMLREFLDILSPQHSGFMAALSGLPELRGAEGAKNAAFWSYTLGYLQSRGSPGCDRAEYARGLIGFTATQGASQRSLQRAIAAIAPGLTEALADLPEATATDARQPAAARADELYRKLAQRLSGAGGGEPGFAAMLEELANAHPETLMRLQRQLQSGELRAEVGTLDAGEARQLVMSLIRLNPGSQDFLRAVEAQAQRAQDARRYYRHILERLIRNRIVDLEAAAADAQPALVDVAAHDEEAVQARMRAVGPDEIGSGATTSEAEHADELYRQLVQRLGGTNGGGHDLVKAIKELASAYPETLARLQRRLQAGELRADVATLDAREARQLARSLIRLNSGAKDGDFLRAIERYAGRAKSEAGYYRYILESLIHNQTIDLEEAVHAHRVLQPAVPDDSTTTAGDSYALRQDDHEKVGAESALDPAGLLRVRLEEALALGRPEGVEGIWGDLLSGHADKLREVFMRRLGDVSVRARLASGFPESMLQELVCALAPSAGRDIEMLATQPELRASGTTGAKNIPLWEYTLSYLHASGLRGYERSEYAYGLVHHLGEQGMSQPAMQQAVARLDTDMGAAMFEPARGIAQESAADRQDAAGSSTGTTRVGELCRQLLHRLSGRDRARELAQEITELADGWPEAIAPLYRQLQSGEAGLDVAALTAREARLLIAAFIAANHGSLGEDIRREIEAHAGKARDERRYYQTVLEMLVRNRVVDLEEAMLALPGITAGQEDVPTQIPMEEKTVSGIGALRVRFESALVQGDAGEIAGVWNDLRFNHGNLVREVFNRRMGDDRLRTQLAERFPGAMLFELIRVLAPLASGYIESLEKQLGLQAGTAMAEQVRRAAREHALSYLYAVGARGFRRADYARDLMRRMAAQGMEGSDFLRAMAAIDPALAQSLSGSASMDIEAAMTDMQRAPADRLRALLEIAFASGDAGELSGRWEELRGEHRELVRAVFMQRMGEARLRQKVADGFPETMLREFLDILSPQHSGFMAALSGLPELRGAEGAKNAAFWSYTLGYLQSRGSPGCDRAEYARGLIGFTATQGESQRSLQRAIAAIAPGLTEALADLPEATATDARQPAAARADELYRKLAQRLSGAGGGEPGFAAMLEELANAHPETLMRLQRQLQSGELRAEVGTLDAGEARQLVMSLIRLNPGSQDFLRAVEAQAQRAQDVRRYYRHILERLIRNRIVDLEAAAADAQPALVDVAAHDEEAVQARTAYLRTLLDAALTEGSAVELGDAWDELRRHHAALVHERFERLMGDERAQGRVAQGFPATMLAELARILVPAESRFIETVAAQLRPEQAPGIEQRLLWQHTLGYLHATRNFDRRGYAESLMRHLGARGASDILQAVAHADPALGRALSAPQDMRAVGRDEIAGSGATTSEAEHADELYRQLVQRLGGTNGGGHDLVKAIKELASAYPETLARLQRRLQAGELRADVATLDAREARQLARSLIRLNSGAKDGDFLRAIERYAGRAKSEAGYYRYILESLIHNQTIDLEEAASVLSQETARQISADERGEENRALPEVETGDKHRPQAEDVRPRATTGDNVMQVENTPAFDGRGSEDESAEEIYIANAGMVLATPYLPQLFRMLDLTEGTKFRDERAAERAIHLLQFMVNESCDSPEFLLSLNKLLCGVPTGVPIVREIELLQREKEAIEGMLNGIIHNWTILGNTSVQGLRESFLQRSGRLQLKEDSWHLKVESKGIDVLLDRLPWSFALIKHPWMRRPIYVEWR